MIVNAPEKRAALITGASYGVGRAAALELAKTGFDIAVTATKREHLERTVIEIESLGQKVLPLKLNLTDEKSVRNAIAEAHSILPSLSVLVNNAGVHLRGPALEITRGDWDRVFNANLAGTFFLSQEFGRQLVKDGRDGCIITITSTHALRSSEDRLLYGVSKAALHQATKMLAVEWSKHGIRVNAIAPGRMLTESPSRQASAADPKYIASMLQRIPLGRMVEAEDVAHAVCFLASEKAASITGQIMVLDGGLTLQ